MKPQYQIESRRGIWNLPGVGWNWLTRDMLFEDRSFFCNVHPWCVCSMTLTAFMVVIAVYVLEDEPAFGYVRLCVLCVYMWVPCTHEKARGGCLSVWHSLTVTLQPSMLACKHQRAICLRRHAGVTSGLAFFIVVGSEPRMMSYPWALYFGCLKMVNFTIRLHTPSEL